MKIKLTKPLIYELRYNEPVTLAEADTELEVESDEGDYWLAWQGIDVYAVQKDDAEIVEQ